VVLASSALKGYLDERAKPELPIGFTDEAGRLMADVQYTIDHLDSTIRSLEGLSGTDHLTGLPNRREGEGRLANDMGRTRRGEGRLTVAVVDVDGFKAINDTHGHQAGDVCIRHVADAIRSTVREGDWLVRWGASSCWRCGMARCSLFALLGKLDAEIQRRGMPGIRWRKPEELLEPSDPAAPVDL
jgi:hypothetical protein